MVNKNVRASADGDFPRCFIKGDGLELIGIVDINRLQQCLWTAEDYKGVTGDVRLFKHRAQSTSQQGERPFWRQSWIELERIEAYNYAKSIPQRGAERLELRWGSPRQYRSHEGG